MKIAFLQDDFPPDSPGGAGFSTFELARGMQREGHEVMVVTACQSEEKEGRGLYEGIPVCRIFSAYDPRWRAYVGVYNRKSVKKLEGELTTFQPDIVHINNVHHYLSFYSAVVASRYARAVIYTARDTMAICFGKLETKRYLNNLDSRLSLYDHIRQARKRWNPLRNFIIKKFLNSVDQIFAVSDALRHALELNGLRNVEVVHTGADVADWQIDEAAVRVFRLKYGLESKKIILFGGRLSEAKGGKNIVEALAMVVRQIGDVVLVVAGVADGYAKILKDCARARGVADSVIFTDWIAGENLKSAYGASDVVWVPSAYLDPFPRVVIEAMSARRPVVGTKYGGAPEIIVDGQTGYVIDPRKPAEIAEKTLNLLKNSEKAKLFGEAGYTRVKSHFNLDDNVKEYLTWYERLLASSQQSSKK